MFAHHIITAVLMMFSYVLNWTRIGNTILCTMDLVDILLPVRPRPSSFLSPLFSTPSSSLFVASLTHVCVSCVRSSPSCSSTRGGTRRRTGRSRRSSCAGS